MKKNKRIIVWMVIVFVGVALITLADALLESIRNAGVSNQFLIITSIIIIIAFLVLGFRKKIIKLTIGQLGSG